MATKISFADLSHTGQIVAANTIPLGIAYVATYAKDKIKDDIDVEIYHGIIDGEGKLVLDDEEVAVKKGVVVYVPRGVKHKAVGDLTVLTVCIPRGVLDDVHEVD